MSMYKQQQSKKAPDATSSKNSSRHLQPLVLVEEVKDVQDLTEAEACSQTYHESNCSCLDGPEPKISQAAPGMRVRMEPFQGMDYQLFLPARWVPEGLDTYPMVVFLHGEDNSSFSVMNSQSLLRLLARNQSTCFDSRSCWCLDKAYSRATAKREAPPNSTQAFLEEDEDRRSPMADCDFAQTFPGIAVLPQGLSNNTGWTEERLRQVAALSAYLLKRFRGDPERVTLNACWELRG
eukprot:TRINITY_DN36268_c0_g1_i2.p1 TRINITY_DN36268_c0_g1~~TRINITY_DN36268_c0_g1_i2.p1  ORF type:complete len:236 (+),score=42.83 TRINITY_DN36268_c0_g1_i2:194-901(+)